MEENEIKNENAEPVKEEDNRNSETEEKVEPIEEEIIENKEEEIKKRKEKFFKSLRKENNLFVYGILAIIVYISVFIRTRNVLGLKDITTKDWTLGPDLDPFLFLRWAEYIVEHGKLFLIDPLRYVPIGYNTAGEAKLLSYLIAWFFKFLNFIPNSLLSILPGSPSEITVTYAAIIFPVFMFALTVIAFFFLTRKIFYSNFENKIYPNAIALIASFFISTIPIILPRTIAGIPEKESAGFLFIFLAMYFFLCSFDSKKKKSIIIYSILAGISTTILSLIWGGIVFVLVSIGVAIFISFILGHIDKKRLLSITIWIVTFMPLMMYFSTRYNLRFFFLSIFNLPIFATWLLASFNIFIYPKLRKFNLTKKYIDKLEHKYHLPREIVVGIIVALILFIVALILLGPGFLWNQVIQLKSHFISPLTSTRFIQTVAENRQPFFNEWKQSFGPVLNNIPIFFWMFILGSVVLFHNLVRKLSKKDRRIFTILYLGLILSIIFSRTSSSSVFNGTSLQSLSIYFGSMLLFVLFSFYVLRKYNKEGKINLYPRKFGIILLFTFFLIAVFSARSGIRFMMVVVPPASIIVSYLTIISIKSSLEQKEETKKIIYIIIAGIIVLAAVYSGYVFYVSSSSQSIGFVPSGYSFQWQESMSWVRDNTATDAVFSHWWDYGYWVQSIGKRATLLDGGNAIVYWDHLLARHVLTNPTDDSAFEFLYTHNATHLLIDSTDIGKYSAFSSIGGDENNDRFSFIPTFVLDESSTQETRDGKIYTYHGGSNLDEDIIYENNGQEVKLATQNSGLGAIIIGEDENQELIQPIGIFVQGNQQIQIPFRYLYHNNQLYDFESGIEAGFYIMESLNSQDGSLILNDLGAGFYLSKRTVNSLLARKYLFNEENGFKLVNSEPHPFLKQIRDQGFETSDFVYFQGSFLGPIKIWEVEYPEETKYNPDYLLRQYPDKRLE